MSESRMEAIFEWLRSSELVRYHKRGGGFFVSKGTAVRLQDGTVMEAIEWLVSEGFEKGASVKHFTVRHSDPTGQFSERITFFPMPAIEAPFSRRPVVLSPICDDDMPF